MKNKALITGGSGLLGSNLLTLFRENFETFFVYHGDPIKMVGCKGIDINLSDYSKTWKILQEIKPALIIHCAAMTNVDYCEEHPIETQKVNALATKDLAKMAKALGSKFVYISTSSVFDGKQGNYTEEDEPNPLNVYAKAKLDGEIAVRQSCKNYLIIRTDIYGWNAQNKLSLAEWILEKLNKKEHVNGFSDIYFTPILVNNLGRAIKEMCKKDMIGTYHVAGSEMCSKLEFARAVADVFGLDKSLIIPSSSDNFDFKAKRPKNASLNITKAQSCLETKLLDVKAGLKEFKKLYDSGFVKELKSAGIAS